MNISEITGTFSYKNFRHPLFRTPAEIAQQTFNKTAISPQQPNNDYNKLLVGKPDISGIAIPLEPKPRGQNGNLLGTTDGSCK